VENYYVNPFVKPVNLMNLELKLVINENKKLRCITRRKQKTD